MRRGLRLGGVSPIVLALALSCGFGELTAPSVPDGGSGCDEVCPAGTICVDGECVSGDPCADVTCTDPGEVCQRGVCVPGDRDSDHDGYPAFDDCDDADASVHPGAAEECNGADDDCDGSVDEGFDGDGDGFSSCGEDAADCDDGAASVHPGADEACNGEDDDCDGEVDEGIEDRECSLGCGPGTETCEGGAWVCDAPETCECSPAGAEETEGCGRCGTHTRTCQSDLSWSDWGPCVGDHDCPVVCGDSYCDGGETCESCPADCGDCPAGCPADGHLGDGENGDPCTDVPEMWRCVFSHRWDDWISQVCRDGIWLTYHINPRDCEACCEDYSIACAAP